MSTLARRIMAEAAYHELVITALLRWVRAGLVRQVGQNDSINPHTYRIRFADWSQLYYTPDVDGRLRESSLALDYSSQNNCPAVSGTMADCFHNELFGDIVPTNLSALTPKRHVAVDGILEFAARYADQALKLKVDTAPDGVTQLLWQGPAWVGGPTGSGWIRPWLDLPRSTRPGSDGPGMRIERCGVSLERELEQVWRGVVVYCARMIFRWQVPSGSVCGPSDAEQREFMERHGLEFDMLPQLTEAIDYWLHVMGQDWEGRPREPGTTIARSRIGETAGLVLDLSGVDQGVKFDLTEPD